MQAVVSDGCPSLRTCKQHFTASSHCVPENSLATNKSTKSRKRGKVARYEYRIFKGRKHHSTLEPCPVTARGAANADIPFCRELGSKPLIRCRPSSVNITFLLTAYNPSNPVIKVHTTVILYILRAAVLHTQVHSQRIAQLDSVLTCFGCTLRPSLASYEC